MAASHRSPASSDVPRMDLHLMDLHVPLKHRLLLTIQLNAWIALIGSRTLCSAPAHRDTDTDHQFSVILKGGDKVCPPCGGAGKGEKSLPDVCHFYITVAKCMTDQLNGGEIYSGSQF